MKKLATVFVSLAFLSGVAVACPHMEAEQKEDNAPRTAEKDKAKDADKAKEADKAKAKEADKAKETAKAKETDQKKPATEKKPDKVSSK